MTKEKTRRPAASRARETGSIFSAMNETVMTPIDRKIHALLIAEGYKAAGGHRFDGMKLNNYTDINQMEYTRGERERVIVSTHAPANMTA